jgi:hypothetical protein
LMTALSLFVTKSVIDQRSVDKVMRHPGCQGR